MKLIHSSIDKSTYYSAKSILALLWKWKLAFARLHSIVAYRSGWRWCCLDVANKTHISFSAADVSKLLCDEAFCTTDKCKCFSRWQLQTQTKEATANILIGADCRYWYILCIWIERSVVSTPTMQINIKYSIVDSAVRVLDIVNLWRK